MIVKMKWTDLIQKINSGGRLFPYQGFSEDGMCSLLEEIDTLYIEQFGETELTPYDIPTGFLPTFKYISQYFMNPSRKIPEVKNVWTGLNIYCSSYVVEDLSPINEVYLRLLQYVGFYKKILTDKGFARRVVTHRDYRNAGHNESTNKNIYSETPQVHLTDFDNIINYVSNATKNEDEGDSNTYGDSDLTVDSKSYEEAEKNLKLIFHSELIEYITSIPHIIYSLYALDSMPVDGIAEEVRNYFKALYERR